MNNILIVALQPQRFLDQVKFAQSLISQSNDINVHFFIDNSVYSSYQSIVDSLEFKVINVPVTYPQELGRHFLIDMMKRKFPRSSINIVKSFFSYLRTTISYTRKLVDREDNYLRKLNRRFSTISKLIGGFDFKVMLLNGDRHLGYEPVFLKISREFSIPSIIVYIVDYADEERIFFNDVETKKIIPNIFTSSYIKNAQESLDYRIARERYYYPHPIAMALKKFGVLTHDPYVMGKGKSDVLCLNNIYYKDKYVELGVEPTKIKVLGDASYDTVYENYKKKNLVKDNIVTKYSLKNDKKIIIVALPQLGEHDILPWDEHWKEISFLMTSFEQLGQNVLVSLHPKMHVGQYRFLESEFNCKILDERLADALVSADLFVATYSSTVVWAVLCGIKTLVVDFYGLNYNMYDFLTSITKVDSREKLATALNSSLNVDTDFSTDWANLSKDAVFDGNTTQRYLELINEVSDLE